MQVPAPLGFTKPGDVSPDHERPGLLRARTRPLNADPNAVFDFPICLLNDLTSSECADPGLEDAGFQTIDLSGNEALQRALATIRADDRISDQAARDVRGSLQGAELPLGPGRVLRVEHVADEGLIHRRAGPAGLDVNPDGMQGANGHGGAPAIHGDQDVLGTPLAQMMKGEAPKLFRHRTPDACNDDSSLFLLNLWIPLQQITRPLVLMDRRSLNQREHQIRYGLPVTKFLERDEATNVNDIWTFLHHPDQRWYFRSVMGPNEGYVFDTLGAPHGACALPGENALERSYVDLENACQAASAGDVAELREHVGRPHPPLPEVTTTAIREASLRLEALRTEGRLKVDKICRGATDWVARARAEMDGLIRKSIEMRLAATLLSTE